MADDAASNSKSNAPLNPVNGEEPHGHIASRHVFRRLYDWTLHWAHTKYATPALFFLAVAESSFFPIPPDVLLTALSLSRRKRALWYALVCSVGSVLGGVIGYWIGYALWESVKSFFFNYIFTEEVFNKVGAWYQAGAFWYIFIAAFTPIPYKVFTIAAGVYHHLIPLWILVVGSIIGRSARFFLVAGLLYFFGDRMRAFVEKYFDWLLWALLALAILGFVALRFLR
jgi:membrane protein YqaA with SNARE-associated domain